MTSKWSPTVGIERGTGKSEDEGNENEENEEEEPAVRFA
jgi:hypothetical protein